MTISRGLWVAYTRIFFVEAAYWIISIGMVFVNQFVLSDSVLTDDLTIFITIFQILFSLAILIALNHMTKYYLDPVFNIHRHVALGQPLHTGRRSMKRQKTEDRDQDDRKRLVEDSDDDDGDSEEVIFVAVNAKLIESNRHQRDNVQGGGGNPTNQTSDQSYESSNQEGLMHLFIVDIPQRVNLETCKIVFPLSILYIGMLLLNNFCLKNVGVAFYFVSRSLTTVFNVIFTYFLINEPVSRGALICCAFIVLGFILGIDQENVIGSLSVIGVSFGVASSLFGSLCSIYTKKILSKLDKNIWVLVLYNNINAVLLCTPLLIMHGDLQSLVSDKVINPTFWMFLSISGVMAFFISIITNASIKYTSPLTHNISGTAKACFQTVIAVVYYKEHKSAMWWLSNMTILVASAVYSRIKQQEMESKTAAARQRETGGSGHDCQQVQKTKLLETYKLNGMAGVADGRSHNQRRDSSSSGCSATSGRQSRNDMGDQLRLQQSEVTKPLASGNETDTLSSGEPKACCSVKIQSAT